MTRTARRLALLGLAFLGLVLLLEWVSPAAEAPHATSGLRLAQGHSKTPIALRAVEAWQTTVLTRPLFTVSRRPAKVAASTGAGTRVDEARLAGIMIGSFGRRAIFAPQGGGKPIVLGEKAAVNESTIAAIEPNRVTLANGTVLFPSFDKNRVPAAYTPPPFQPPPFPPQGVPGQPAPGFPMPRFAQPPIQQPPQVENESNDNGGAPPAQPVFRGQFIPNRRE